MLPPTGGPVRNYLWMTKSKLRVKQFMNKTCAACTCNRLQSVPWKPIMNFDVTTLDDVKAPTTLSLRCSWETNALRARQDYKPHGKELNITNNKNELWKSVRLKSFQKPQLQLLSVNPRQVCHLLLILYLLHGYQSFFSCFEQVFLFFTQFFGG